MGGAQALQGGSAAVWHAGMVRRPNVSVKSQEEIVAAGQQ
jgi:hypothetical protein